MNECFLQALPILERIEEEGFEAVFVGGSVRDYLLNRNIHDVDIATSANPEEIKRIFPKTVDVGIQHGTVMVIENGISYEITTYRVESEYIDNRKPKEVKFIRSLKDDLQRRDFTMNAIAMNRNGELIDPFLGQQAIQQGLILTVGNPDDRFREDALRMMRAIRFVSQLSFSCSQNVLTALEDNRYLLKNISVERITAEFEKLLIGDQTKEAIQLMVESKLFEFLPGLADQKSALLQLAESKLPTLITLEEKWTILLMCMSSREETESFLRRWKLPIKRIRSIKSIIQVLERNKLDDKMELFTFGLDCLLQASRVRSVLDKKVNNEMENVIVHNWDYLPIKAVSQLAIDGKDLLEWTNRTSGPWIKEMLYSIIEMVVTDNVKNSKEEIYKAVKSCNLI